MGMQESMNENMRKQMAFQKQLILKQRQSQVAMQIALGRERFWYFSMFYYTIVPVCLLGAFLKKNPQLVAPIIPLSFAYFFQKDMFYGNMFERAQIEADDMILQTPNMFRLPSHNGIVTDQEYDQILSIKNGKGTK